MNPPAALWPRLVLGALGLLLIAGFAELFRARFARGDVYPPYSSLRGDPLGTRVLHDGLQEAGMEVSRNFRDLARAQPGPGTLYLPGLTWTDFAAASAGDVEALLASVRAGGRLVLGFAPTDGEQGAFVIRGDGRAGGTAKTGEDAAAVPLTRELGLDARWLEAAREGRLEAVRVGGPDTLPGRLSWHSALAFEPAGGDWRRIHAVGRHAAILERDYGSGTIVVVGDAFALSNEAMARSRQTGLLIWLQGSHERAVFDETHLGVEENAGIAALARRYGLAHAALALLLVALLHLWRSGSSLVPRRRGGADGDGALVGRDASTGLASLLKRTLPAATLFAACVGEYKRSVAWRRLAPEAQRALDALVVTGGSDPRRVPEMMRAATELLKRKT